MTEYFGKHHSYLLPQDNYYTRKISNTLKNALHLSPEKGPILEIGCGAGRFSFPLLNQGIKMTCVDNSSELTEIFRSNLNGEHDADVKTDDLFHIDQNFEFIIGFFVLHHFKDHAALFSKIRSILKRQGKIGFIEPNPFNPLYYFAPLFYKGISNKDEYYFMCDRSRLKMNLAQAGFKNIQVIKFGFLPPQIINLKGGAILDGWTELMVPRLCHLITAELP